MTARRVLAPPADRLDITDPIYQASCARALEQTLAERAAIEQRFGVRFDPTRDGQLLMEKRTQ